jgi:alpha-N-arabinofuranosidase
MTRPDRRLRRVRSAYIGLTALVVAGAALVAGSPASADPTTTLTVTPGQTAGQVSSMVLGGNGRWAYDNFGAWDADTHSMYPAFTQALQDSAVTSVRYPGGTIANLYHWQQAVKPLGQRVDQVHGATGEPLNNHYGPDEYGRYSESLGQSGSIVVNFSTGTPQEAADWVEYMTGVAGVNANGGTDFAALRASNGHPAPYDIPYWEVGNEMSISNQFYWRGGDSAEDKITLYANGGSTGFTRQRVGKYTDYRSSAGVSTGNGGQNFQVKYPPLQSGTEHLFVGDEEWTRVTSLSTASATDKVFTLDLTSGAIHFGNGVHGAVPPAQSVISATYTSGTHPGFDAFYAAMKQANPNVKVCAGLTEVPANREFAQIMGDTRPYDCLVQHAYFGDPVTDTDVADYHGRLMLKADGQGDAVRQIQQAITDNAGAHASQVKVIVSEYGDLGNTYPVDHPDYHASLSEGLLMANDLRKWIELGVPVADRSNLNDFVHSPPPGGSTAVGAPLNAMIAGPSPDFVEQPTGLVPKLFRPLVGGTVVGTALSGNPSRTLGNGNQLPALTTVAARQPGGDLDILVINQDASSDVTTTVAPGLGHAAQAQVSTLNGASVLSLNTPGDQQVSVTSSTAQVGTGAFTYTFPAHSVTRIRLTATS